LDGILNIDKPAGKTSYGVVAAIKKLTGERHAGHAGTLDPDATGVLPVCLGRGTRIVEFLVDVTKTYRAQIELGTTTDTYDGSGKIVRTGDPSGIDISQLEKALDKFRGPIQQVPPMYSALKHKGRPLYELARAGIDVERKSRPVQIHRLEITDWQPPLLTADIECSKGTYIRSLANDLGEALGCGAFLKGLVRTGYGIFNIKDAVSLPQFEEACRRGQVEKYLHPIDSVLQDFNALYIDEAGEQAMKTGSLLHKENIARQVTRENSPHRYYRAYSSSGQFLGMLQPIPDTESWQPKKVFI
jgi:tRNA pseudouridine55 synthase